MNNFDASLVHWVNQFAGHSWTFDKLMRFTTANNLVKDGVIVMLVWWAWFKDGDRASVGRRHVIATLIGCAAAIVVGRALAWALPFRLRPMHEDALHFVLPFGMERGVLEGWSSFPSDHALLFFALATGLLFVSRTAGWVALAYTALVVCLPRIYLGLHYPTDILAGALLGIAIALLVNLGLTNSRGFRALEHWSIVWPQTFYPLLFLATWQIADTFEGVRTLAQAAGKALLGGAH